ncbi:MAG: magnesium transporter [Anaerolineales bacterium]
MEQETIQALVERIQQDVGDAKLEAAITSLTALHPADRAEVFFQLNDDAQKQLMARFSVPVAAEILEELSDQEAVEASDNLSTARLANVLDEMEPDEAADLLGDLTPERAAEALSGMQEAEEVIPLLSHPDETAGGLMTTSFVALERKTTSSEAIQYLREISPETETPYYLYVIDDDGRLAGVVGLRDLIVSKADATIESFMDREVASISNDADQEDAARTMARYDLAALPVVDFDHVLQGVITYDDVIDVFEEEATEDVFNLAGIEGAAISDRPYWSLRIPEIVRSRFVWLLVLFVAQTLTTAVLRHFQGELQTAISLSFFVPLLIGTGGNAGAQTVTTVIRAIALDEVQTRDVLRVIAREVRTGLLLGFLLAVVAYFWVLISGVEAPLALVVSITVFAITIWANLVGAAIPIFASWVGVDPTVMSAPLISTLVDATGLLIYFSVAILVLKRL